MKLAIFDENGFPAAFYDPDMHQSIPVGVVQITEAQWRNFIEHPGLRRWSGGKILAYTPPPIPVAVEDVYAERDRRLALGFDYDFGDGRGVHRFATTERDMRGWDRVTKLKDALLAAGDTTTTIRLATETGQVDVTAPEWNAILLHAAQHHEQPIWQASFVLAAMDPLPDDYADDSRWPS